MDVGDSDLHDMESGMTPSELITYARQQYNAVSDGFFSDAEMRMHVWSAQDILSKERLIENAYDTTTVIGQQEYTYPTNAIAIRRITYDGKRLTRIDFREDDIQTGFDADTTSTGVPTTYVIFDRIIRLRPIPSDALALKIFTYDRPQEVTNTSTLDVPEEFHLGMVDYLLWRMASKDQNFQSANYYKSQWDDTLVRARQWARKRKLADSFNVVRDEEGEYSPWRDVY